VTTRTSSGLDGLFRLSERGTTTGTEVRAGVTTFMVMAYIIFVNPSILSVAGYDAGAVAAGTALVAGVLTIAMGVVSNYPLAMAAGLGINGAVAFGLVLGQGLSLEGAMGVIVLEGLVVLLLVLVGFREAVMNAVPLGLKRAIGVGIGLFILFIGFANGGLIRQPVGDGPVPVEFIFPNTASAGITLIGLLITIVLYVRKVPGALIISILATTLVALLLGVQELPDTFTATPSFSTLGQFDLGNVFSTLGFLSALLTIFSFMLTDFFDTMGTATAIAEQSGLADADGSIPGIGRVLLVDSVGAVAGGAAGVSSNTSYIEGWSHGIDLGGHRGLVPFGHLPQPSGRHHPSDGYRPGADHDRIPDVHPHQGHRLRGRGGGVPGAANPHTHAAHVQHHRRHWRRLRELGVDQVGARQGQRGQTAHVGRSGRFPDLLCPESDWRDNLGLANRGSPCG